MKRDYRPEWIELTEILTRIDDKDMVEKLLHALLTQKEREEISLRWTLVKQLYEGRPQRAIAADLGVSLCKITRGSKELKQENSVFPKLFRLLGERNA